jgi:transcriptional regulator with XRE-family HTH domain
MSLAANVAANLKRTRIRRGLSQEALARKADLSVSMLSMLERGQRKATLDTLETLAAALEARPADFLRAA